MRKVFLLALVPAVALGASVVKTIDAPDTGVTGLAWGSGSLWAADGGTGMIYEIDPADGTVLGSFYCNTGTPSGLAYMGGNLHALNSESGTYYGYVYKYSEGGSYQGAYDSTC